MKRTRWRRRAARARSAVVLALCLAMSMGGLERCVGHTADTAPAPAGHWALDEGSGTSAGDSSGHGCRYAGRRGELDHGTGGGLAVALSGTANGNIDIPQPVVDTSQSFTVSAWVRLNSLSGFQTAVSIDGVNISGFFLQLSGSTGSFAFTRRTADSVNSTEVRADSAVTPVVNTWYHLVGVNDTSAGTLRIYVDGVRHQRPIHLELGGHRAHPDRTRRVRRPCRLRQWRRGRRRPVPAGADRGTGERPRPGRTLVVRRRNGHNGR